VGQGVEVLLVARVVPVRERPPDLAGRWRGHEDLVRAGGRGSVLEILDVTLHRRPALPRHGPRARRPLLERRRELPGHLGPLREFLGVRFGPGRVPPPNPAQACFPGLGVAGWALPPALNAREPGLAFLLRDLCDRWPVAPASPALLLYP